MSLGLWERRSLSAWQVRSNSFLAKPDHTGTNRETILSSLSNILYMKYIYIYCKADLEWIFMFSVLFLHLEWFQQSLAEASAAEPRPPFLETNCGVLQESICDKDQVIHCVCQPATSQKYTWLQAWLLSDYTRLCWGKCFLSPRWPGLRNDWKMEFNCLSSKINKAERGLVGVVINFEPQRKELVLNEHRRLTDSPHTKLWAGENVQH